MYKDPNSKHNTQRYGNCIGRGSYGAVYLQDLGESSVVTKVGNVDRDEFDNQWMAWQSGVAFKPIHFSTYTYQFYGYDSTDGVLQMATDTDYRTVAKNGWIPNWQLAWITLGVVKMYRHYALSHRDLHAWNVLVARGKTPKLIDFGSAKVSDNPRFLWRDLMDLTDMCNSAFSWNLDETLSWIQYDEQDVSKSVGQLVKATKLIKTADKDRIFQDYPEAYAKR